MASERYARLLALAEPLRDLDFEDKTTLANLMGLVIACCPGCGCWVGKPGCHDQDEAESLAEVANEWYGGQCRGCPDMETYEQPRFGDEDIDGEIGSHEDGDKQQHDCNLNLGDCSYDCFGGQ